MVVNTDSMPIICRILKRGFNGHNFLVETTLNEDSFSRRIHNVFFYNKGDSINILADENDLLVDEIGFGDDLTFHCKNGESANFILTTEVSKFVFTKKEESSK